MEGVNSKCSGIVPEGQNIGKLKMLERIIHTLRTDCGVLPGNGILVALSGGADSVALLHLLMQAGQKCVAAHCNFSLRGIESDGDESFVRQLCSNWNIELHVQQFDTIDFAKEKKISIEMAARQLRYRWFEELAANSNLQFIATGHHGDDAIETFFLNLVRGTGLKGLRGISVRNGKLIRPLLFASRNEIVKYCNDNNLTFRTDSTNDETVYLRNKIRHTILPLFSEINPSFFSTMQTNMSYLNEAWQLFSSEVEKMKELMVAGTDDALLIPIKLLNQHPQKRSMLFEVLRQYGFSGSVTENIIDCLDGMPGRQFFSETHRIVIDRYNLVLVPIKETCATSYHIEGGKTELTEPINLTIKIFEKDKDYVISTNPRIAHFDADQIDFPLTLRHSIPGDRFQPLGMPQFKKISDFFIDEKLSLIDKEQTWLLLNDEDIIWMVGHRIDNRYKIKSVTKNILEIRLNE